MRILFFLLLGCTPKSSLPKQKTCGNLSGILQSVAQAVDPLTYAKEKSLLVNTSQMRVMLTLQEGVEAFWSAPIETELSIKQRHQLLLPPTELCSLGQDGRVVSIALPKQVSPK